MKFLFWIQNRKQTHTHKQHRHTEILYNLKRNKKSNVLEANVENHAIALNETEIKKNIEQNVW